MKFSLWLEMRSKKTATKMPVKKTNLELVQRAANKNMHNMKHGKSGVIQPKTKKGTRGEHNRKAINEER